MAKPVTQTALRKKRNRLTDVKNVGYEGATWNTSRGYVYFPTLDSRRDLDGYTLRELRRRSRWLYVNSGFVTRIIDGIANMIGALTPVPLTGDKEWNQLALESFTDLAGTAGVFDVGGRFNFWTAQIMLTTLRLIDGDILGLLASTDNGVARVAFYEAHQVDNSGDNPGPDWTAGVRTNAQGRPIQYRIVTPDEYGFPSGNDYTDVSTADSFFCVSYRRPGRVRGEPALRHAINHLLDRSEIMGFVKSQLKNAAQIGYQITRSGEFTGGPVLPPRGMGSGSTVSTNAAGEKVRIEDALKGGKIAEMDPGEEIKLLLDQRPHPNQVEYLDYLARDSSWGLNCSSDLLWNIAKLGGATVRYVVADAQQGVVDPGQELLADQFCSRFWVYFVAKEMKRGALRQCDDPKWWKHGWQPQQKLTVDIGRDGKLYLDMHRGGLISLKRYHAQLGQNWQQESDDYLDERAYVVQGAKDRGLTLAEAFPDEAGRGGIDPVQPAQQDQQKQDGNNDDQNVNTKDFLKIVAALKTTNAGPSTVVNVPPINVPPPVVNIGSIKLPDQKAPVVYFTPQIKIPEQRSPVINVAAAEPAQIVIPAPQVTVNVPPAQVNVENRIDIPATQSIKVTRDEAGKLTGIEVTKE